MGGSGIIEQQGLSISQHLPIFSLPFLSPSSSVSVESNPPKFLSNPHLCSEPNRSSRADWPRRLNGLFRQARYLRFWALSYMAHCRREGITMGPNKAPIDNIKLAVILNSLKESFSDHLQPLKRISLWRYSPPYIFNSSLSWFYAFPVFSLPFLIFGSSAIFPGLFQILTVHLRNNFF